VAELYVSLHLASGNEAESVRRGCWIGYPISSEIIDDSLFYNAT
jgi:hypothetical protein